MKNSIVLAAIGLAALALFAFKKKEDQSINPVLPTKPYQTGGDENTGKEIKFQVQTSRPDVTNTGEQTSQSDAAAIIDAVVAIPKSDSTAPVVNSTVPAITPVQLPYDVPASGCSRENKTHPVTIINDIVKPVAFTSAGYKK